MKPRSSKPMGVLLLGVLALVFLFFFWKREGFSVRSTTIGMYDYLKPIPEGNKWTPEVRSKFMKTYNQIPEIDKIDDPEKLAGYEVWALQAEAEYYINNRAWPVCQYVQNYIANNPDFIPTTFPNNSANAKSGFAITSETVSQIFPNRILYLIVNGNNQEANRKPLSYQYFTGTALPPSSASMPASTPTESGGSVSALRASKPTKETIG